MANITTPQAITFTTSRIRTAADHLTSMYFEAKRTVNAWNALQIGSVIPNTADVLIDGSTTPITGAQATAVITRLQEFITDYEASSNAKLNTVTLAALNP